MFLVSVPIPIVAILGLLPGDLPATLTSRDISNRILIDPETIAAASTDFGQLTVQVPAAVFCPSSDTDISNILRIAFESSHRVTVAARGHGHSVWGQASAPGGVVVDMRCLAGNVTGDEPAASARISVSEEGAYVDAGGEQFWIEILRETLKFGLAPKTWTDYLYLTVGGTLSNAGLSGQTFRHGPQISNVNELDVINGNDGHLPPFLSLSFDHSLSLSNDASPRRKVEER